MVPFLSIFPPLRPYFSSGSSIFEWETKISKKKMLPFGCLMILTSNPLYPLSSPHSDLHVDQNKPTIGKNTPTDRIRLPVPTFLPITSLQCASFISSFNSLLFSNISSCSLTSFQTSNRKTHVHRPD